MTLFREIDFVLIRLIHALKLSAIALGVLALSGCDLPYLADTGAMTGDASGAVDGDLVVAQSAESLALTNYYARVEAGLLAQGLLRTDGGGPDAPYTSRNLTENFIRIALFEEYTTSNGQIVARQTAIRLHRWETPVRMKIEFGASVPMNQRINDTTRIVNYADRLSRITGLQIRQTGGEANYHVFVVNEDERRALGPRIRQIMPGISDAAVRAVVNMPRSTFCLVFAGGTRGDGAHVQAVAVIRGEHPDLMRMSCIHEELAQGLGLPNDSPSARPSIFNDDEEFAFLTGHDEMLLRILYDDRIRVGMTSGEARPQAEVIAAELIGGGS